MSSFLPIQVINWGRSLSIDPSASLSFSVEAIKYGVLSDEIANTILLLCWSEINWRFWMAKSLINNGPVWIATTDFKDGSMVEILKLAELVAEI